MAFILPVAGGKGGVGKSVISLNLSVKIASQCNQVLLCDLDFGGANLHTMLGLKNNQSGLGHFVYRLEDNMNDLIQATGVPNLHFIAGDCLFPGVANIDFFMKQRIIKELEKIPCDYLVLDLGAGSANNTIDFFLMTYNGLIVVTPELTSILNAYSFLKSVVYRFCYRQFSPKSPARQIIKNCILQRLEGRDFSFAQIMQVIEKTLPGEGTRVLNEMKKFKPRVIMNMGRGNDNVEIGYKLQNLVRNKLSIDIEYIGFVPYDETVQVSIAQRKPAAQLYPQSSFSQSLSPVVQRIYAETKGSRTFLYDAPEDFSDIVKEFYESQNVNREIK